MTANALETRLNEMPPKRGQIIVLAICLLLNVADGFDVMVMSYAAPGLSADWSVAPEQLGIVFSAALVGMALGSMVLAPFADRFGRRNMILVAALLVSMSMFAVIFCDHVWQLVVLRLLAGLGIGIIVPTSATVATEYAPVKIRSAVVVLVTAGFSVGMVAAGLIAGPVISAFGWQGLFVVGGAITFTLFLLSVALLKESVSYLAASGLPDSEKLARINSILTSLKHTAIDSLKGLVEERQTVARTSELFKPEMRLSTTQAWFMWFAYYWASYVITQWVPTLFVYNGYTQAQGIDALTYFGAGSLIGAIVLGFLSARFLLPPMVAGMLVIASLLLAGWVTIDFGIGLQMLIMGVVGFMISAIYGFYPIVSNLYPARIRVTGIGSAIGFGRLGAMSSPLVAGFVVGAGWDMQQMILTLVVPAFIISAVLVVSVSRRSVSE